MAPYRAGVIPMIDSVHDGQRYFCYGVDATYKTLIDLGGHIEAIDTSYAQTAYREFSEETLGALGNTITLAQVAQAPFVYDDDTLDYLVLLPSQTDLAAIQRRFAQQLAMDSTGHPEVIDLVWLTYDQLAKLADDQIYFRSRRLISRFPEAVRFA